MHDHTREKFNGLLDAIEDEGWDIDEVDGLKELSELFNAVGYPPQPSGAKVELSLSLNYHGVKLRTENNLEDDPDHNISLAEEIDKYRHGGVSGGDE